jgi:enolase
MITIKSLKAYWILDSRGNPTVQTELVLSKNSMLFTGVSGVPSGASTGSHEALELRDGGEDFAGKGVSKAVNNINTVIAEALVNKEYNDAKEIESILLSLDKTPAKSILGANAVLAVSIAAHKVFAKTEAKEYWQYIRELYFNNVNGVTFPLLMSNIINGGAHASNGLSIQECMVIPHTGNIVTDVQASSEIYGVLKKNLAKADMSTTLGDEGGFAPNLGSTSNALKFIMDSVNATKYSSTTKLALDCAATEFYDASTNSYNIDGMNYTPDNLVRYYSNLQKDFPIISIEDGASEDDLATWKLLSDSLGSTTQLVGDDLFVTNISRFKDIGLAKGIGNSVLIKLNQIGSVSETCDLINLAHSSNYTTIISHRSGETTDTFMSDLAIAAGSKYIKLGAPARGERVAKYNRLLAIYHSTVN